MSNELQWSDSGLGHETFGVPITLVHEIVRVPEITSVPDAPDFVEGVINLRGKIVPVVDLRKRFGETRDRAAQEEPRDSGRIGRAGWSA